MNYQLHIAFAVSCEIGEGWRYYEEREEGLGSRYAAEVYAAIEQVADNPYLYQKRYGEYRIVTTRRFRYKVIYRVDGQKIWVVAVQHGARHPMYWKRWLE